MTTIDEYYMQIALKEAKKAYKKGEVPVGSVIVINNKIVGKGYNKVERKKNITYHAEIIALTQATKKLKNWRLDNCVLYTTMEPCMMCCGAIQHARISKIVYGIKNEAYGCSKHLKHLKIVSGICENECKNLVQKFFKKVR